MLFQGRGEPQREVARAFFKTNRDALFARLPKDSATGSLAGFADVFAGCDAATRDEAAAYMQATFAAFPGGDRTVAQAIESMDQCIARKALLAPQLERW
jgi:alanyl aminopeptidase